LSQQAKKRHGGNLFKSLKISDLLLITRAPHSFAITAFDATINPNWAAVGGENAALTLYIGETRAVNRRRLYQRPPKALRMRL